MSLTFRAGDAADLKAIYELNIEVFPESWSRRGLSDALESGYEFIVCFDEKTDSDTERLAGYILSRDILDEVHIMQVAVAPEYRRQGIAEELSRTLMLEKQGRTLMLEVRASNEAAQALYHKLGFVRSGIRKDYYVPASKDEVREDAVLMHHVAE